MIFLDVSQIFFSSILSIREPLSEDLIRHVIINNIRSYRTKFKQYNDMILCCDSKTYWRRSIFPYYKSHRKESRDKSAIDWNFVFPILNQLKQDLKEHFPYKTIEVETAEADDIIAVLTKKYSIHEPVLIISSDADFKQLHKYPNVKQYNPILNVFVTSKNPTQDLKEKIIRGDKGDGIPSILSQDDTFVIKKRQSPITQKKLDIWLSQPPETFCESEDILRNYHRNNMLINLDEIPENISVAITNEFDASIPASKQTLYKYLLNNKLINLLTDINDF